MQQQILYNTHLPQFIISYKQKIIHFIIPKLIYLHEYINNQSNQNGIDPVIMIVTLLIVFYVVKNIYQEIFANSNHGLLQGINRQSPQLNHELNDLKKQLKGLKSSFGQLAKQLKKKESQISMDSNNNKSISNLTNYQHIQPLSSETPTQLWTQLIPLYTNSLQNNKKLVNYVLESQIQVLRQLKRFKKHQRDSLSSGGRPSTVRSKTSQKKYQSQRITNKSPIKNPTTTSSSIKKSQIKDGERLLRSELYEKKQRRSDDVGLFIQRREQQKDSTSNNITASVYVQPVENTKKNTLYTKVIPNRLKNIENQKNQQKINIYQQPETNHKEILLNHIQQQTIQLKTKSQLRVESAQTTTTTAVQLDEEIVNQNNNLFIGSNQETTRTTKVVRSMKYNPPIMKPLNNNIKEKVDNSNVQQSQQKRNLNYIQPTISIQQLSNQVQVTEQNELNIKPLDTQRNTLNQNYLEQNFAQPQNIQNTESKPQQQIQTFIPPKMPTIKKPLIPKPGQKRAPPPPIRK